MRSPDSKEDDPRQPTTRDDELDQLRRQIDAIRNGDRRRLRDRRSQQRATPDRRASRS